MFENKNQKYDMSNFFQKTDKLGASANERLFSKKTVTERKTIRKRTNGAQKFKVRNKRMIKRKEKKGQEMLFREKEGVKERGKENNCSRHFILSWSNKARLCFTANQRQPVHTNTLILQSLLLPSAKW